MVDDSNQTMDPTLSNSLHEGIRSLYEDNALADVVIRVEGKEFPCHRLVLSAVSPYFRSMFTNNFQEKDTEEVVLQSVKSEIFQCILQYIYSSEKTVINEANVQDILTTASMFLMQSLVNICVTFISKKICTQNAISMWRFAETIQARKLTKFAKDCILQEFESVTKEGEFLDLKPSEIIEIIKDQSLNVTSEEYVGDAVFKWMLADEKTRKNHLCEVLQCVRLPHTRPDYVFSLTKKYPFLYEKMELIQVLDEAKYFHCQRIGPNNCSSKRMIHRNTSEMVNGMLCVIGDCGMRFSFQKTKWIKAASMSSDPGLCFASCVVGNNFYVSGGNQNQYGSLLEYRPEENKWVTLSKLGRKRSHHALVGNSQMFYLVGGSYGEDTRSSKVTEYIRKQKTYRDIGNLYTAVRSMDAALVDQKIYVFGGNINNDNEGSKIIQCFDLTANQGSKITQELSVDVTFTGATVVDESVFLVDDDGYLLEFANENLQQILSCGIPLQYNSKQVRVTMCYFNRKLFICVSGRKIYVHSIDLKTRKPIGKIVSLRTDLTSEFSYALGTLSYLKKNFQ